MTAYEQMRDALVQVELFLSRVERHGHPTLNPGDRCDACEGTEELRELVCAALAATPRNCDALSKEEALAELDSRSFSKEDTIEWLYAVKGETDGSK